MSNIAHRIRETLVPHTAFEQGIRMLERCLKLIAAAGEPICIAIIGESRTGKSRLLKTIEENHPRRKEGGRTIVPVLRVGTPSKPTVKGLAEIMLAAIGDPMPEKGTEVSKTNRLIRLLNQCGTRIICVDEFQHFFDKTSNKIWHHVADWLKGLVDQGEFVLVVAGLPECMTVIRQNEQLAGRFLAPIRMPRLDWNNPEDREEFKAIIAAFQEALSADVELPNLDSDQLAFRIYCATGGLMGYVTSLLRQVVWDLVEHNRTTVTLSDLAEAFDVAICREDSGAARIQPFAKEFASNSTPELLEIASSIGKPKLPPPPPSAGRRMRGKRTTAADQLSA